MYSHFPFLIGMVLLSVGLVHAIDESEALHLQQRTVLFIWSGFSLWLLGSVLLHYIIAPADTRSSAPLYGFLFLMVPLLILAGARLAPVAVVGLLLACYCAVFIIDNRGHKAVSKRGKAEK